VPATTSNDPDRDNPVASFVRERRRANRLTQRQLAELAGVGLRFVSELERGKPTARLGTVDAVLRVFGKRLGVVDLPRGDES
jgi:y4mF family transcriptional regulator